MKVFRFLGKRGRTTIPLPLRIRLCIQDNELVSFEDLEDGSVLIRRNGICTNPGDCVFDGEDTVTLYDILNSLNVSEKKAVIRHLSNSLSNNIH